MSKTVDQTNMARVREAIRSFVQSRYDTSPVSIADMKRRVRYVMPEIDASDDELCEMIARAIIEAGGNVAFDSRAAHAACEVMR